MQLYVLSNGLSIFSCLRIFRWTEEKKNRAYG